LLDYLKVENFAVVEKVELRFSPHLNVLTGETGAGKSILMGALNHFLRKKIPENAIRSDSDKLVVEAMFSRGEDEFILRREVNRNKSICFVDGNLVPFSQLKEMAESLLNIYGQNEHIFLLNPNNHRLFLDQYCDSKGVLDKLALSFSQLKENIREMDQLKRKSDKACETLDFIRFQIEEIENLKMNPGDDEVLEQRVTILSSAEEILSRTHAVVGDLYQRERSVYSTMAENLKHMEYLKGIYPELDALYDEMRHFYHLMPEISSTLSNIQGSVDYSEDELNEAENRLMQLNRLKKKYKMDLGQLLQKRDELVRERDMLRDMDFSLREMQAEIDKAFREYKKLNLELREKRKEKAAQLSKIVEKELARLEMSKARFEARIEEIDPDMTNITDKGADKVEFFFSSNPGQQPGRIKDIASGGELSRLMLVLKSILSEDIDSTYIFDEIDTGIGGKTAEFVGEKLCRIAEKNQVICISHLPQIASFAESHFMVSKEFKKDRTFSFVNELSQEERVSELGRLMAGSVVSGDVLKAAQNLLEKNRK